MLPNCVIIGAQKAGTTFLKLSLGAHRDVDAPRGECPFFEDPHYDAADLGPLEALFEGSTTAVRVIKRPDYLARPLCASRIHRHLPDARLIAVVRHPVERAVSAYFHYVARGLLPLRPLNEGMARVVDGAWDVRFPAARDVLEYGCYHRHLRAYTDLFPRDHLLVIRYEELRRDFDAALAEAERFLELAPERMGTIKHATANESMHAVPRLLANRLRTRLRTTQDAQHAHTYRRESISAPRRWTSTALRGLDARVLVRLEKGRPELAPSLRSRLVEHYREDVDGLEAMLEVDLTAWRA